MTISPQRLTIYLYSAHRAVIFAIAQLSCLFVYPEGGIWADDIKQESPAVADKPARRESMPKIDPIRRAYTTLSPTILHSFSCCCVRNLRNPEKFSENSNFKVIDLGVNRKRICNFLLVINSSNFGRISYSLRDIDTFSYKIACFRQPTIV